MSRLFARSRSPRILLLLVLAVGAGSCSRPRPPSDALLFGEALQQAKEDPPAAVQTCQRIQVGKDRDHCLASVVEVSGAPALAEVACPLVNEPLWVDECYFMAGELSIDVGDDAQARRWCDAAGTLRERCLTHLWRRDAERNLKPVNPTHDAGMIRQEVQRLYSYLLGNDPSANARAAGLKEPWKIVLLFYFRQAHPLDLSTCEALHAQDDALDPSWCKELGRAALFERLGKLQIRNPDIVDRYICRHPSRWDLDSDWPGPTLRASGPMWADTPELRAALRDWGKETCGE